MVAEPDPETDASPLTSLVTSVVTLVTLATGFGLLAVGWPYFWIVFPIGFGGLLPAAAAAAAWYRSRPEHSAAQTEMDAELATLREQYADGDIDDETFETRVERLLETESIEDAETFYGGTADDPQRPTDSHDHSGETETERELN